MWLQLERGSLQDLEMRLYWILGWVLNPVTSILRREEVHRDKHRGDRVGWVNRPSPASLTVGNSQIQFERNIQDCSDLKNSSWLSRSLDVIVESSRRNCKLRNLSKCCQGEWNAENTMVGQWALHRDRNRHQLRRGQGSEASLCSPNPFMGLHHNSDSSRTVPDATCGLEDKLQLRWTG